MHGILSRDKVVVTGLDAESSEFRGYGRKQGKSGTGTSASDVTLTLEEAAFLLEAGKLIIAKGRGKKRALTFEELLKHSLELVPNFGARYIVYKDLKERGYLVQPAGGDFWLYPRGARPGAKPAARYFIRIFSEREFLAARELEGLLDLAHNMRKEPIIAVVDDESDITYYEVKGATFAVSEGEGSGKESGKAFLLDDKVLLWNTELAAALHKNDFYGTLTKGGWLLLSFVEAAYLMKRGMLDLDRDLGAFVEDAASVESNFKAKYAVYEDLREKGLTVKTGFKFGSHFRVYKALDQKHSLYLIHVLPHEHVFSMPELARAVRLAHGVKKRMVFAFIVGAGEESRIRYVDIGRMKL
jgi:tRNA-intron endonuclease